MLTHSTKQKITVTLDQDEADLLVQAVRIASRRRGHGDGDEPDLQNRSWMLGWAIAAVSRAIIRTGSMPCPLGVELRPEISAAAKEPITGGTILPASRKGACIARAGKLPAGTDRRSRRPTNAADRSLAAFFVSARNTVRLPP